MPHIPSHPPPTGLIGSEQALQQGLGGSLDLIARGFAPFVDPGVSAFERQAAQAGALGPEQQRQAFAEFTASPGQAFLREQGEQALLRNQAAIGGIGGGNVRSELQRQGIGFAAQDFGNQFDRLGALSRIGADLTGRGVSQGAQNIFQTGGALAGGRTRAGEQIAGQVASTTSALADLLARQGAGGADIIGAGTGDIADILATAGTEEAGARQDLGALLAELSSRAGGQVAGLPGLPGLRRREGVLSSIGEGAAGIGTAIAAFSDIRLKKDIVKIGQTEKGINLYTWTWNEIGRRLTGRLKGIGVIAQEIREIIPEAVTVDQGWLRVDYNKVL